MYLYDLFGSFIRSFSAHISTKRSPCRSSGFLLIQYSMPSEVLSMAASSSAVNAVFRSAPRLSRICSGEEAPISTEVTALPRSTQASAISASDCPRAAAIPFSVRMQASVSSPNWVCSVAYTHLRAHETGSYLLCRLLLEKKKILRLYVDELPQSCL